MADIVYRVKETLDGYVPSNVLKTIKPGVAYYVGMPLVGGADGMLEPTEKNPEYICMADFKADDEVPRLDVPCMKVGPQIIFEKYDSEGGETITQISGGGGVQSDLSVNDESDPAFVKGRTHYVTKTLETVLPETTYETYDKYPYGDGYYWSQSTWSSVHSYTFRVTFDGVVYDNLVSPDDNSLGNLSFENGSYEDNGLPFVVTVGSMGSMYIVSKTEGTHTIKAENYVIEYVKLDSNYLSDDVLLNKATGYNSCALIHAEASGSKSFACMFGKAKGEHSYAEGYSWSEGQYSHSEGYLTYASSDYQHAQGKFNIKDTTGKYAHIVGNGTDYKKRSNAHTLDWSGNAWFAGTIEGTGIILKSSTADSTKRFLVTVDDSGTLTATEITE